MGGAGPIRGVRGVMTDGPPEGHITMWGFGESKTRAAWEQGENRWILPRIS